MVRYSCEVILLCLAFRTKIWNLDLDSRSRSRFINQTWHFTRLPLITHPWIHGLPVLFKISVIGPLMFNLLYYCTHARVTNLSLKKISGFWGSATLN